MRGTCLTAAAAEVVVVIVVDEGVGGEEVEGRGAGERDPTVVPTGTMPYVVRLSLCAPLLVRLVSVAVVVVVVVVVELAGQVELRASFPIQSEEMSITVCS